MASSVQLPPLLLLLVLLPAVLASTAPPESTPASTVAFDQNYAPAWGGEGYHLLSQGAEIRLSMDKSSAAGFVSKSSYGSGFFHMRIKVPGGYTAGVVTAFYLISEPDGGNHDEVDFEFLGNVDGKPITLQTNVFLNGTGRREQSFHLWFDPAADFHDYKILWNPYQLVAFVDDTPIRVLTNLTGSVPGYEFPAKPMRVRASVWDGSPWATDGGKTKIDWSRAPFTAGFEGFSIDDACADASPTPCNSPDLSWNADEYRMLTAEQQAAYENVKKTYRIYNYCADKVRFKNDGGVPIECSYN